MPALYSFHMKRQYKFFEGQKQSETFVKGSSAQISVREIELQPDNMKNGCLGPDQYMDDQRYKAERKAMGRCSVPWAMNNTLICTNRADAIEANKAATNYKVSESSHCLTIAMVALFPLS